MEKVERIISSFVIWAIKVYQVFSKVLPPRCRFFPSCSAYTIIAVERFGLFQGIMLAIKRIFSCHPLCKRHGVDLVPMKKKKCTEGKNI